MTALRGWDRTAGPVPGPPLRPVPAGHPRPAFHPRMVAAATAASCLVHLWLAAGNHHGPWLNLLMLALVGVCLPCAVHIWRDSHVGSLRQVMACGVAMTVLHAALLLGGGPGYGAGSGNGTAGHSHGAAALPAAAAAGSAAGSAAGGLLAVIALEITTALLAATLLARLRRV